MWLVSSLPYSVRIENSINVTGYDGILFISVGKPGTVGPAPILSALTKAYEVSCTSS